MRPQLCTRSSLGHPFEVAMGAVCPCLGRDKVPLKPFVEAVDLGEEALSGLLPEEGAAGTPESAYAVAINERKRMEDAVLIHDSVAGYRVFACLDGHGGQRAVAHTKAILATVLAGCLEQMPKVEDALRAAFLALDEQIIQGAVHEEGKSISSGVVLCVILHKDRHVYMANLGDCKAVLSCDGLATQLMEEHAPHKSKMEEERLRQLGVEVDTDGYLKGELAVSRALGDVHQETGAKLAGLTADPDVIAFTLDDHEMKDLEFVILATDGIWDGLRNQTAVSIVRRCLRQGDSPATAVSLLFQEARKLHTADNSAAIVIIFKIPEPAPKRPNRFARPSS